jgi:serine/threonine-protein kinase
MVGSEKATMPFFSPDGRWVGYSADRMLKRTPLGGGPALVIVQAPATGATWGPEDRVVFQGRSGLSQVSIAGGAVSQLTTAEKQNSETSHRWPEFLPGGRVVMFTAGPPPEGPWYDAQIVAQSLATGERHVLIRGAQAHYVSDGASCLRSRWHFVRRPVRRRRVAGRRAVRVLRGAEDHQSWAARSSRLPSGSLARQRGLRPAR